MMMRKDGVGFLKWLGCLEERRAEEKRTEEKKREQKKRRTEKKRPREKKSRQNTPHLISHFTLKELHPLGDRFRHLQLGLKEMNAQNLVADTSIETEIEIHDEGNAVSSLTPHG